jgi:hypothetical protein
MKGFVGEPWRRYYPTCQCDPKSVELVRIQDILGRFTPVFRCPECSMVSGNKPIKRGLLDPQDIADAVVVRSHYGLGTVMECEVCGKAPAERHHWAPSWLCQPCHSFWHKVVNKGLANHPEEPIATNDTLP